MTTELDYKMSIADTLGRNGGSRFTKNQSDAYLKAIRALEELQEKEHNADRAYADFESVRRSKSASSFVKTNAVASIFYLLLGASHMDSMPYFMCGFF